MFEIRKNSKQVVIVGTGDGWERAPKDSSATIYALNDFFRIEKYGVKYDRLFIMDVLDEKPQIVTRQDDLGGVIKRINDIGKPLIAPYKYEEIPLSEAFPLEKCYNRFGVPYFTNTIGYMIAYALLEGVEELHIFGINQASQSEYYHEKCGVEYWLGIANGMGVKIIINGEKSELLTSKARLGGGVLYGYNMNYQVITDNKERFGERIQHRLLAPPKPFSRIVRKIN